MVAIGRALMSNPRVLLCDEISLGLAPVVIRDIYAVFPRIRAAGASIVIVEQDIGQALKVADRVYCMMEGRITLSGAPVGLTREAIHAAYFGAAGMTTGSTRSSRAFCSAGSMRCSRRASAWSSASCGWSIWPMAT